MARQTEMSEHLQFTNEKISDQKKILISLSRCCDNYVEALDDILCIAIEVNQSLAADEMPT